MSEKSDQPVSGVSELRRRRTDIMRRRQWPRGSPITPIAVISEFLYRVFLGALEHILTVTYVRVLLRYILPTSSPLPHFYFYPFHATLTSCKALCEPSGCPLLTDLDAFITRFSFI
jgi:hypothetical protein